MNPVASCPHGGAPSHTRAHSHPPATAHLGMAQTGIAAAHVFPPQLQVLMYGLPARAQVYVS